jgi:hypothetical protein
VRDLLGACFEEKVAVFCRTSRAPGLEKVLQTNANFSLHTADRLLQRAREYRIRLIHSHRILKFSSVMIKHGVPLLMFGCSESAALPPF